jgi:cellulose synthase/poly-beta-1,6-N-acetylglucosamine synthase-like glycosyltransferase
MIIVLTALLFGYVLVHTVVQIIVSLMTWRIIREGIQYSRVEVKEFLLTGLEPPISVVIPAYNEEQTIVTSIRSMLQLRYPQYEVVVVNDGSRDGTLDALKEAFQLEQFPQAYHARLTTRPVRGVYRSRAYPSLRVIDKENGGKADGINCGINASRYPLFCCVDADSILERDSLLRVVQPFITDPRTVAVGGTVRLANGCDVRNGNLLRAGLTGSWLARFQIVEYLRGFLFGRMGWAAINGLLIISGAFGVMRKDAVIEVGGYRHQTIGEDMELIVRLHRSLGRGGQHHRIRYVAEPICWTEAPENWRTLRNQRVRWQRGLCESLWLNRGLLMSWPPSTAGWLAFPYFLLFEWAAPMVEFTGYLLLVWMLLFHGIDMQIAAVFLLAAIGFAVLLSSLALMLEEISFHIYPRYRDLLILFAVAILENFGYRQINVIWRLQGTWQWLRGKQGGWGVMQRKGMERPAQAVAAAAPKETSGSSK